MAMTIGRVGTDITLTEPSSWSESSDGVVTISGTIRDVGTQDGSFLREQLIGLADPYGEQFVPVTVGHDSDRNGWYQVLDVSVDHMLGATENHGARGWSATLRRLPYRSQPRYELHKYGTVWTNSHSITTGTFRGYVALPATATAVDLGDDTYTNFRVTRTADTGSVAWYTGQSMYDTVISAYVPLEDAYDGAAKIEVDVTGSGDWYTVVGTEIRPLPTRWRLGNGLVRATWDTTNFGLAVEVYDSSVWEELGTITTSNYFLFTDASSSYIDSDPVAVEVLRNDPLACTLRLVFDFDSAKERVFTDVTVRRGDRNVFGVIKSRAPYQWGVEPSLTGAATALTSGTFSIDANDDAGNRWVMSSPKTANFNSGTGAWRVSTSSDAVPWAIGCEFGGSGATGQNAALQVSYAFFSQPTETLFVAKN